MRAGGSTQPTTEPTENWLWGHVHEKDAMLCDGGILAHFFARDATLGLMVSSLLLMTYVARTLNKCRCAIGCVVFKPVACVTEPQGIGAASCGSV